MSSGILKYLKCCVQKKKRKIKVVVLIFVLNIGSRLIISTPACIFLILNVDLGRITVKVSKSATLNTYISCSTI